MSKLMDHIAYLSQEIGPRPAGTEEEQQAALYITDRLQKDAHLTTNIEDFTSNANPLMPNIICYGVSLVACVIALFVPLVALPAAIVAILSAVVYVLEAFDKPVLSQLFMKGVSQNVVAKYEPTYREDGPGARRRKIIVVANYDSGKVRRELAGPFVPFQRPLQYAALVAMVLLPIVLLLRTAFFSDGPASVVFMVIAILCAVAVAIPEVFALLEKFAPFNEAANSNASGVAVMLEVARRLGNGEVAASSIDASGIMHDEETARAAGVVPEGATISYEDENPGLAAAKASLAAFGGSSSARDRVSDISSNLVQVKEKPLSTPNEQEMIDARQAAKEALANVPKGTLAEAAAKAFILEEENAQRAAREEAARVRAAAEEAAAQEAAAAEAERVAELEREANKPKKSIIPEWYRKATQKARSKKANADEAEEATHRSRYADVPTASSAAGAMAHTPASDALASQAAATERDGEAIEAAQQGGSPVDAPNVDMQDSVDVQALESRYIEEDSSAEQTGEGQSPAFSMPAWGAIPRDDAQPRSDGADSASDQREMAAAAPAPALAHEQASADASSELSASAAQDASEPAAKTSRLPQMMYYTPPQDRSELMRAREQKDRVVVSASAADARELAEAASVDQAAFQMQLEDQRTGHAPALDAEYESLGATTAMPPLELGQAGIAVASADAVQTEGSAPAARVISANIPVVELPEITLPPITAPSPKPISFEELRQRAPLASVSEAQGQQAAKSLLASTLPSIEPEDPARTVALPALDNAQLRNSNVSLTGSFAAIGAVGADPVGDELLQDIDPNDIYVDDADDTVFEEEFTETGAFAGPGYVDMPQSRVSKFFGRFSRKKKQEEESAHDWLGVDEDFDARAVGKARGGWESFREDDETWQGGAFSGLKARFGREEPGQSAPRPEGDASTPRESEFDAARKAPMVSNAAFASAYEAAAAMAASHGGSDAGSDKGASSAFDDVQQIYSFAAGDINTEVWFVALGSELANNGGIKAFLADHASDMRGAVIVNLESLGAGTFSFLDHEGKLKQVTASARMKRFLKKASQASGTTVASGNVNWRESPASYALKHRMQAMTLAGMDGAKPAGFGQADDIIENVDEGSLEKAADFVVELLKNI